MGSGGAIQVKLLSEAGKESATTPFVVRAHSTPLTALSFLPFHENLLLSAGGATATVKLWSLPVRAPMTEDVVTPLTTLQGTTRRVVVGIVPHPSADSVVATYSRPGPVRIHDIETGHLSFEASVEETAVVSSAAWTWDGSAMVVATQDQAVRILDPRIKRVSMPVIQAAHTGKRHSRVIWCGRTQHFMTCGSDRLQARELKLWDPRQLAKCIHWERLDAGSGGSLIPLYDADLNLLYVLGKGDRSARVFEVDLARAPSVQALNHSALKNLTLAATWLPKATCDTTVCEVARVLNLSASGCNLGGSCEVLSYRVPRKEAPQTFQSDLYPATLATEATLTSAEWRQGRNAEPKVQTVMPTVKAVVDMSKNVYGPFRADDLATSSWGPPALSARAATFRWQNSNWGQALSSTASSNVPSKTMVDAKIGYGSSTRKWNDPENTAPRIPTPPAKSSFNIPLATTVPRSITTTLSTDTRTEISPSFDATSPETGPSSVASVGELSDKAQRLSAKCGHKLKYLLGKEALRDDVFHSGDFAFSTQASPVIAANAAFWAAPIIGAGGPVLVETLDAKGKAHHGTAPIINGHKAAVSALAFNPFNDFVLATGSTDSTIQLWSLNARTISERGKSLQTLSGHTKGLRSLEYNPTAADVLCSSSYDLSLRFWDIEAGQEKLCLEGKLDDITWNMAFSQDGALLATASRAKIVRVFDPRQRALVAMGCGHESHKPQFITWLNSSCLLTVGVNSRNETQISFWDSRNLLEPLRVPVVVEPAARSANIVTPRPLYDMSSHLLFLVGTGSRHIWSYEVDPGAAAVQANIPFMMSGTTTIGGCALLPKTTCNIRAVELARLLVVSPSVVKCVSFSLPRAQKLKEYFQDDVYGLVPKQEALATATTWFAGESSTPVYESLCPDGMIALSKKPKSAPTRPKTLDFQAQKRKEEEIERRKAAQFAQLSSLAAQPSLHATRHSLNAVTDDSDEDWDD